MASSKLLVCAVDHWNQIMPNNDTENHDAAQLMLIILPLTEWCNFKNCYEHSLKSVKSLKNIIKHLLNNCDFLQFFYKIN